MVGGKHGCSRLIMIVHLGKCYNVKWFVSLLVFTFLLINITSCSSPSPENNKEALAQQCCTGENVMATCKGSKSCNACKNCKYCKHCSKDGGSCGVCSKK